MGERHTADTPSQQPQPDPTKRGPKPVLSRRNVDARKPPTRNTTAPTAGAVRHPDRPRVHADPDFTGRWLVEHQGHVYPFPAWGSAVTAALKPQHLCRYTCICPVRWREAT